MPRKLLPKTMSKYVTDQLEMATGISSVGGEHGEAASSAATESTKKVRSHYLRGHVESAVYHIAKLTDMAFDEEEYISRAGHELETFKKSYCRPMVERQKVAIMAHPRRGELSAEEIQFK